MQDTRFGHTYSAGTHGQVGGNIPHRPALHDDLPEGGPGALLEIRTDHVQGARKQTSFSLFHCGFTAGWLRLRYLRKTFQGTRSAHPSTFLRQLAEMIAQLVLRDPPQPAAKGVPL